MRERGYSLFEFAISVIVFALVLAVALQRMGFYQQAGEQAVVQAIQINLRTALGGKVLALQARGAEDQIAALAGANPVEWLEHPPAHYAGVLQAAQAQALPPGSWYFDATQQQLVYVRDNQETSLNSAARNICFRVELQRLPEKNANAKQRPVRPTGVELIEVTNCRTLP
ncbi:type II secretion system protein [Pseudoduganella danionis]|uniref:type II secretion system protein n=2 Tax=Pseudoduganella danionis TaxID=1890295 RepID=UPI0012D45749|nr:type II secretion system protein [Pseudoduganella danionis]